LRATLTLIFQMFYSLVFGAQTVNVLPLASEPHHHLSLHNEYVNVYRVQVAPHDSVLLHRHDFDAISVMLDDAQVAVYAPGKQEVHRKLMAGQIRLQPRTYVHSTTVEGDATYRNVTVELLLPQEGAHNLCSGVIPDQPLNCPAAGTTGSQPNSDQPQFESDETSVNIIRVAAHQKVLIGHPKYPELAVAIGADLATEGDKQKPSKPLSSGDFVWMEGSHVPASISNSGDKESNMVVFTFRPR
jgi:hypothetical protein